MTELMDLHDMVLALTGFMEQGCFCLSVATAVSNLPCRTEHQPTNSQHLDAVAERLQTAVKAAEQAASSAG